MEALIYFMCNNSELERKVKWLSFARTDLEKRQSNQLWNCL